MNKKIEQTKLKYPKGTLIELQHMEGEMQMERGLKGTITVVDDIGQIHVSWENGSSLALNPDVDSFSVLKLAEQIKSYRLLDVSPFAINTRFICKDENIEFEKAFINQVVELSDNDFNYFSKNLLDDYPFIHQLQEHMKDSYAGNRQTIAIVNESNNDGILVDSQGYGYARYAAYVDEIKPLINQHIQNCDELLHINKQAMLIKVIVVEPQMHPYVAFIKNDLLTCQSFVGGSIEVLGLSETACLICNEEGKLLDLQANRKLSSDIICGRFIISGQNNEGDLVSLNQKDINRYMHQFHEIEQIKQEEIKNHMSIKLVEFE